MKRRRCLLLLEVLVGLALLAGLGVALVKLQGDALRQVHNAQHRERIAQQVEDLLAGWSASQTVVTLPATGRLDDRLDWRREVRPTRIASGVLATQISVIVTDDTVTEEQRDVYRVDWLLPDLKSLQEG